MASRKLARDFFITKQPLFRQLLAPASASQRVLSGAIRLRWTEESSFVGRREFSVFNEFSNKFKGEASRNQDFQKSVKELKEKTEELKGVKEGLKARTKQTTEQLYKQVDGVWTEAEATARKVYSNVGEKISAAKAEVKESFGFGKQETPGSTGASKNFHSNAENGGKSTFGEENQQQQHQQSGPGENSESLFGKVKSGVSSKASMAFQKVKEARPIDMVKKGYDLVKDELKGNVAKRKHLEHTAPTGEPSTKVEKSSRTDIAVLPSKQSKWGKKWDAFMEKMRGHPLYKRARGISEPVVTKSQEIAEDVRERWETSDHPVVHKIQDLNDTVFGETATAMSFKEIRQRDPSFSLPEFVSEVQEVIKPVLNAYFKCDVEILKKYCSSEVIERCKAEHKAFESQDIFFDNKILHISEVEVQSTKMMGESPIIVVAFQTQQVYCVRDRHGAVKEGGKDTIHTVYYAWAMQQVDPEELGEGALYPIWRIREMQQFGVQALI